MEADVLFIFDCCYAASSIRSRVGGTREFLAACGKESTTTGSGDYTFTRRLIQHLEDLKPRPFSITELQSRLTIDKTLRHSPIHAVMTQPHKSIILTPLVLKLVSDPEPSVELMSPHKLPRVLISAYINDNPELVLEDWTKWLATHVPNGVSDVRLEGVFRSGSALILFSVPAFVWSQIPENPSYLFVGLVESTNLLAKDEPTRVQSLMAMLEPKSARLAETSQKSLASFGLNPEDVKLEETDDDSGERTSVAKEYGRLYGGLIDDPTKMRLYKETGEPLRTTECRNLWTYLLQTHFPMPTYAWQVFDSWSRNRNPDPPGFVNGISTISTFTADGDPKVVLFVNFEEEGYNAHTQRIKFWEDLRWEIMYQLGLDNNLHKLVNNSRKLFAMWVYKTNALIEMCENLFGTFITTIILEKSEARRDGDKIKAAWNTIFRHFAGMILPGPMAASNRGPATSGLSSPPNLGFAVNSPKKSKSRVDHPTSDSGLSYYIPQPYSEGGQISNVQPIKSKQVRHTSFHMQQVTNSTTYYYLATTFIQHGRTCVDEKFMDREFRMEHDHCRYEIR